MKLLSPLIGQQAVVDGIRCQVIEILDTEPEPRLVVGEVAGHHVIQPDQHGEPHRRVERTFTLPLLNEDHSDIHPVIQTLAGDDRVAEMRRVLKG
jgi:hypothetical protein